MAGMDGLALTLSRDEVRQALASGMSKRVSEMQAEYRQDLAVRIVNELAERIS